MAVKRTNNQSDRGPLWRQGAVAAIAASLLSLGFGACSFNAGVEKVEEPPLFQAVRKGSITEAEDILDSGEFVNRTSIGNQMPLHIAAGEGNDEMVRWLLAREARITPDQNGKNPIDFAEEAGHPETAKILRDYQQFLEKTWQAANEKNWPELKKLLANDPRQYAPLHIMAQLGEVEAARQEIEAGADVNAKNVLGLAPLHKVNVSGNLELAKLLVEAGADVNVTDRYHNMTPLHTAVLAKNPALVEQLLKAGADLGIKWELSEKTVLEVAEKNGNAKIVELLREAQN